MVVPNPRDMAQMSINDCSACMCPKASRADSNIEFASSMKELPKTSIECVNPASDSNSPKNRQSKSFLLFPGFQRNGLSRVVLDR